MPLNFLEYYNSTICPKLKKLDTTIKSYDTDIDITNLSSLLDISENEINYILKIKNLKTISSGDIITIMLNGSSYLCKIFKKTLNIGCPEYYTAQDLSYIYNLEYDVVKNIFASLNIDKISYSQTHIIFKHISYKAYPVQLCQKLPCQQ